ncbi:hypothetical protein [Paenibacillus aceti]|uniref:DUF2140 domain-containing protein n=1 Tax=Paenibacillus aceti TaxID=1820010 RepID=A0ABQ1W7G1_9BACL|nr:hypothetical protein [Paenibacillus aceti]GGG17057.1 hypothetical protein GCM10010913_43860 [Paenibacillus aceti]
MRKSRFIIGGILIFLVVIIIAAVLYVRPSRTLDMQYSEVDWKDKLSQMVSNRNTELILSESDINNLAKRGITEYIAEHELPIEVTGAEFSLDGNQVTANLNGAWKFLDIGAEVHYQIHYSNGVLALQPDSVKVRHISIPPQQFGLEPMHVDVASYLPQGVTIDEVDFPGKIVRIKFSFDWLELINSLRPA